MIDDREGLCIHNISIRECHEIHLLKVLAEDSGRFPKPIKVAKSACRANCSVVPQNAPSSTEIKFWIRIQVHDLE